MISVLLRSGVHKAKKLSGPWCYSMRAVAFRGMTDVALARRAPGAAVENGPTTDAALLSIEEGVATITLNQPDNKNALSVDLMNALGDHLITAEADDAVRVRAQITINLLNVMPTCLQCLHSLPRLCIGMNNNAGGAPH